VAEVLTPMRRQILEFIITCQRERKFPAHDPRDWGSRRSQVTRDGRQPHRGIESARGTSKRIPSSPAPLTVRLDVENPAPDQKIRYIPFVGDVAAGTGVLAQEHRPRTDVDPRAVRRAAATASCSQVRGESMIEAGISAGRLRRCRASEYRQQGRDCGGRDPRR
jgi:SOS-response transcriptional repressor LexA